MLCLQYISPVADHFELALFDLSGRRLHSVRGRLDVGTNMFEYSLMQLPAGIYLVKFLSSNGSSGTKIYLP